MIKSFLILLLVSGIVEATSLNSFWIGDGSLKQPQDDQWPAGCTSSTCTTGRYWDGTTGKNFGFPNETVPLVLTMYNPSGSDVTNTSATLSNLTSGASVISSTAVLCAGVTNYTQRPIEEFWLNYSSITGVSRFMAQQDAYEQNDMPVRFRRPCTDTDQGNDYAGVDRHSCVPNGGTTFASRPDANKYYPDATVPMECVNTFTVATHKSQSVWWDIYLSKTLTAGTTYTGTITVWEGASVSTTIPVAIEIKKGFVSPDTPGLSVVADMDVSQIDHRHASSNALLTHEHYYQFMHRHGIISIGDKMGQCSQSTKDFPCPEYQEQLNGTLFNSSKGYGNGRGADTAVGYYCNGVYVAWPGTGSPAWSTTDASNFCTNFSSWSANMQTLAPNATWFLYLEDEALNNAPKYSNWIATVTTCQVADKGKAWVTSPYPSIVASAPYINMPVAGSWMGTSSATYATDVSSYETTSGSLASFYNGDSPWMGTSLRTEDDGIAPMIAPWAAYKKGLTGVYFIWDATYWADNNAQSCGDNDLFNKACTFDCCNPTSDTSFGLTTGSYENGDGVLIYPGHDTIKTPDYGFDGPIGSWRLKQLRTAIQDYDRIVKANTINASSTTAIVANAVPIVLFEKNCFTLADCTYTYGGRQWSSNPASWATNREDIANIIAGAAPATGVPNSEVWQGGIKAQGGITFQ